MRKRSGYRPRDVLAMPLTFGISIEAKRELALRERQALTLMLDGRAEAEQYQTLVSACEAAIWSCDAAARGEFPQMDLEAVAELRARLVMCAQALLMVRDRHTRTGRYGCSGTDRAALVELCDHMDSMREQMPRRCWMEGYRLALQHPGVPIPRP